MGCPNPCVVHWALLLGLLAWKANSQSPDTQRMGFATDNGVHNDGQASRLQENQAKYADPDTFSALVARGTNPNNDQHWQKFDNETYPLKFNGTAQKKTLQQVNAAAPVINITMGNDTVQARPHVRQVARTPDGSLIASGLSLPGAPAPAPAASRQSRKGRSKSPRISQDEVGHLTEGPDGSLYINGVRIQSAPDAAIHKVADAMKQAQASSADQQAWPEVARLPVDSSEPFPVDSSEPSPAAAPSLAAVNEEAVRPLVRGNSSGHAESVHSMSAGNKHGPVRANTFRGGPEAILDTPLLGGIQGYSVDILSLIVGVRVSMPWLGWGFNFCVGAASNDVRSSSTKLDFWTDLPSNPLYERATWGNPALWVPHDRIWSSWPKVGIVIPNPVAWLLPEFVAIGNDIQAILRVPSPGSGAPLGARISPTSDGFLIWLPSVQPRQISDFGFRYGIQIAQLFGIDFGFGWTSISCGVEFVRV